MRPDQVQRLQELSEALADRFILEADPQEWPGAGKAPTDMTPQERGDQHWAKKLAMGTASVLRYTLDLSALHADRKAPEGKEDELDRELDQRISEAERRAKAAVKRALDKAAKATFDKRVHGTKG